MRIGIIGPADRAVAWEKHLRVHHLVSEVVIARNISEVGNIDACFLLDDQAHNLDHLLEAIKFSYHTFLVAPLPVNLPKVEKIYHAAQESNVHIQFSHWPTLAPATKWMHKKVNNPSFIEIDREINHTEFTSSDHSFDYYWIDELAFCLRWVDSSIHHMDLNTVKLGQDHIYALNLFLRFKNTATANIFINTAAENKQHHRMAADRNYLLDCNVLDQKVRLGEESKSGHLFFKKETFDASKAAELAALEFIKAIQFNREPIYNAFHLWELNKTIKKVKNKLVRL